MKRCNNNKNSLKIYKNKNNNNNYLNFSENRKESKKGRAN